MRLAILAKGRAFLLLTFNESVGDLFSKLFRRDDHCRISLAMRSMAWWAGEDSAFLPADEMGEVVSGEVGAAFWLVELGVGGIADGVADCWRSSRGSRGFLLQLTIDGFCQQMGTAGVKFFDGGAGGVELGLD